MKIKVESSNLEFVEYIADKKELRIWFLKEKNVTYTYLGVEPKMYDGMIGARSIGGFFAEHIKNKYKFGMKRADFVEEDDKTDLSEKISYIRAGGNNDEGTLKVKFVKIKLAEFLDYILKGKAFPDIESRTKVIKQKAKEIFGEKLCPKH